MMNYTERYSRQIMLPRFGAEKQQMLKDSSVLIVGLGGLGAPVATYLTSAGVGCIGLADNDTVSLSNLHRQILYDESMVGQSKCNSAHKRLSAMSSVTAFVEFPNGITMQNAFETISDFDLVIDCTDNFSTRYLLDDVCFAQKKPWVHGAISGFEGIVTVFNYRNRHRYTQLYPDKETLCSEPVPTSGVIGALPGVIGSVQSAEAIKILTGIGNVLDGKILVYDMLNATIDILDY